MRSFHTCVCAVAVVVHSSMAWAGPTAGKNLLKNPAFQQGQVGRQVPGWGASGYAGGKSVSDVSFTTADGGRNGGQMGVLRLGPQHSWVLVDQHVPVAFDRSKAVELSVWLRADRPVKHVDLVMFLAFPKQRVYDAAQIRRKFEIGTSWRQYRIYLDMGMVVGMPKTTGAVVRAIVQAYRPCPALHLDDASLVLVERSKVKAAVGIGDPRFLKGVVDVGSEAGLIVLKTGEVALVYFRGGRAVRRVSSDAGQTWGPPEILTAKDGKPISGITPVPLRLNSGSIGMFFNQGERKLFWTVSPDDGKTWTVPRQINQKGQIARMYNGSAAVLSSGRIVGPTYTYKPNWYGKGHPNTPGPQTSMYCWLSDDEGRTWHNSKVVGIAHHGKEMWFEEGSVVELKDGRVLMMARTPVGRLFRSYSEDGGESWSTPEPTPLASAYAPCALRRIPATGDLLCIWNQNSLAEDKVGLRRHRLSCAVSSDGGLTWKHFRNLESLDHRTKFQRKIDWDVFSYNHEQEYHQPRDLTAYPKAPNILRCAYPNVIFAGKWAVIEYDYGCTPNLLPANHIKVRSLPVEWFYEKP